MTEYLVRVRGDRLDLGYLNADVLTVQQQDHAEPGQIVIADRDGQATLTRHDGTLPVLGLVTHMHRRILGAVA